jgi:hypothetical protein
MRCSAYAYADMCVSEIHESSVVGLSLSQSKVGRADCCRHRDEIMSTANGTESLGLMCGIRLRIWIMRISDIMPPAMGGLIRWAAAR